MGTGRRTGGLSQTSPPPPWTACFRAAPAACCWRSRRQRRCCPSWPPLLHRMCCLVPCQRCSPWGSLGAAGAAARPQMSWPARRHCSCRSWVHLSIRRLLCPAQQLIGSLRTQTQQPLLCSCGSGRQRQRESVHYSSNGATLPPGCTSSSCGMGRPCPAVPQVLAASGSVVVAVAPAPVDGAAAGAAAGAALSPRCGRRGRYGRHGRLQWECAPFSWMDRNCSCSAVKSTTAKNPRCKHNAPDRVCGGNVLHATRCAACQHDLVLAGSTPWARSLALLSLPCTYSLPIGRIALKAPPGADTAPPRLQCRAAL